VERVAVLVVACFILLVSPASGANTRQSWASGAIATVTSRGIFPGKPATFRPDEPLTAAELASMLTAIGAPAARQVGSSGAAVSISSLDAAIVRGLGLRSVATQFAAVTRSAGLDPPSRFGTEVVARLLGLRTDLPPSEDKLEPQPSQPASRAEAAFSAARVLSLAAQKPDPALTTVAAADASGGVQYVKGISSSFAIPPLSPVQQEILRTAVSLIGYPYVWGGENEKVEPGFDCSGFVWRVFKLTSYADAPGLSETLTGRTAAQMALDVPRSERIQRADLEPGDVLFFRPTPKAKASQIDHTAIYLGNDWLIESAGQGVSVGRLDWFDKRFAWAQRPLAEIGLEPFPEPAQT
jgi:cell wall-associated NlpC family hydrolase